MNEGIAGKIAKQFIKFEDNAPPDGGVAPCGRSLLHS